MKRKMIVVLAIGIVAALMLSPVFVQASEYFEQPAQEEDVKKPIRLRNPIQLKAQNGRHIKAFATYFKNGECLSFRDRSKPGLGKVTELAELPDPDELDVDDLVDEYIDLIGAEDVNVKRLWILVARERS
jgi:hypothetical protein